MELCDADSAAEPGPGGEGPPAPETDSGSGSAGQAHESVPLRGALRPRGPIRFEMNVSERDDVIWLQISGELDILTTPRLAAELNTIVRRTRHNIVLDLRQADFVDSAGLQTLLGTQRRLRQASRKLTVVCDEGPVRRLIELTRLEEILGLMSGAEAEDG